MKGIQTLLFLWGLFHAGVALAQDRGISNIIGIVENEKKTVLPNATVQLHFLADSTITIITTTDSSGTYRFKQVPYGSYYIEISVVGMQDIYSRSFTLSNKKSSITIPTVTMKISNEQLRGIQVQSEKPLIQQMQGQTIINIGNHPISSGNSVLDVLKLSPGVFIDESGAISLNGRYGVTVAINGQPTHLPPGQLALVLNGTPAARVSRIELMTQPPVKYSAEGTAGLINIILKKPITLGTTGDLALGIGYRSYLKYNIGGGIKYKNKHISLYSDYHLNYGENKFEMEIERDFMTPNSTGIQTRLNQKSQIRVNGYNHIAQVGLDYNPDSKHSIGILINTSLVTRAHYQTHSPVYFKNEINSLDSISTSINSIGYNLNNSGINIHYIWNIDSLRNSLTTNVDYNHFHQSLPQYMQTTVEDSLGNSIHQPYYRKGIQPNNIDIYALKVAYIHSFRKGVKLETGAKYSYIYNDNNSIFTVFGNDQWINDLGSTNHFRYKERVLAGYIEFHEDLGRGWQSVIGMRAEETTTQDKQFISDSSNKNSYFELYPNISAAKRFNSNNSLRISYSRRIDKPSYKNLNPFRYYIDKYTYQVGNPYLHPQFVQSFELSYNLMKKYSATIGYSHTHDIMTGIVKQIDTTHTTIQTQGNLSKSDYFSLNLGIPVSVTKWWKSYNSVLCFYQKYTGTYDAHHLDKRQATITFNTIQNFIFPNNWGGEFNAMFRSRTINGPSSIAPLATVSIGIQKSLWANRAAFKFNIQDLFQSMDINSNLDFGELKIEDKFHTFQRTANLTFTWNFGSSSVKVTEYKNTGIKSEKSRIKQENR